MARLPPSRHAVHRGLRIPDLRKGDDSPLRISFRPAVPATCLTRGLQTQGSPHCGLSGTSQTQSRRCAEGSSQLSSDACRAVHAVAPQPRNIRAETCDAVVLVTRPGRKMRLAQVELAFDPAPRLVLELSGAKKLVDVLALRRDQQQLDLVVQLAVFPVGLIRAARAADMLEPFSVTGAQRP